jgi:hypothetical protein
MKACLVVLLWCGVAAAQPARLPPPPPAFNPAQDAPHTIGQPGHLRPQPKVEPGPQPTRVLPQTPETMRQPSIYAGDDPKPGTRTVVLGVPIPLEEEETRLPASERCSFALAAATVAAPVPLVEEVLRYSQDERACVVLSLFTECLRVALGDDKANKALRSAWERVGAETDRVCKGRFGTVKDAAYSLQRLMDKPPPTGGGVLQ